nr:hypothetical protein [Tanacetum cinerariifolium]
MKQENIQTSGTAKFPILKQDYALWDVIENGTSFKPVAQTVEGSSTPHISSPVTAVRRSKRRMINKSDLDKIIIDHLYNNFKFVEQEVKRNDGPSLSSGSQNMAFVSTPSTSNNDDVSTVFGEDLEQIHEDDLKEMDLKWQLALLSMRAKRVPRNQENKTRNQETTRRTVNVEDTSSKAMMAIDGASFDWSYMDDDEAPTNIAFIDFSDSELYTDNTCSKNCLKNYETLKT